MKRFLNLILPVLLLAFAVTGTARQNDAFAAPLGEPLLSVGGNDLPGCITAVHDGYTASYSTLHGQPLWVAWSLAPEEVVSDGDVSRSDEFLPDPLIDGCVTTSAYSRTGYDRGHMAPAADFRYDQRVQDESFYMSNVCVQSHGLNEGTWFELEKRCRFWARNFYKTTLWIVAGPVFSENPERVGKESLPVPSAFWKVVCKQDRGLWEAVGFVFPNEDLYDDYRKYAVSVDEVEALTGLDFYAGLEGALDEGAFDLSRWR